MQARIGAADAEHGFCGRVELDDAAVTDVLRRSDAAFADWRATPVTERAQLLVRIADAYDARQAELADLISTEMGKPTKEAVGEVQLAGAIYRWYGEHGPDLLKGEKLDPQGADESLIRIEPIGPLIGVMPWNYPYYQVARFVAPNLMAGNTIILKHASEQRSDRRHDRRPSGARHLADRQ